MDIFFRIRKSLIKMKDKIDIERDGYLIVSSLDGKEKCILQKYNNEERALEILNEIDKILDDAIKNNVNSLSIEIPSK